MEPDSRSDAEVIAPSATFDDPLGYKRKRGDVSNRSNTASDFVRCGKMSMLASAMKLKLRTDALRSVQFTR